MKKSTSVGIKQQSVKIRELTPKKNPKGGAGLQKIGGMPLGTGSSKRGNNATKIVYTRDEIDEQ